MASGIHSKDASYRAHDREHDAEKDQAADQLVGRGAQQDRRDQICSEQVPDVLDCIDGSLVAALKRLEVTPGLFRSEQSPPRHPIR
jgi:hypothetical protein